MYKPAGNLALSITLAIIAVFTVIFCIVCQTTAFFCLKLNLNYYFVYKYQTDNIVSASSLSTAAENIGAGYVLTYNNKYYVTIACYYDQTSANSVCFNLKSAGEECSVLAVNLTKKPLSCANSANSALFLGNINTIEQAGQIIYACANSLDKGECTQNGARQTLNSVRSALNGLYETNESNCFTSHLCELITICDEILNGDYIYTRSLRKLQIAAIDVILSVNL